MTCTCVIHPCVCMCVCVCVCVCACVCVCWGGKVGALGSPFGSQHITIDDAMCSLRVTSSDVPRPSHHCNQYARMD